MHIGYLHFTQFSQTPCKPPFNGVTRYGQHLATAAQAIMSVTETTVNLDDLSASLAAAAQDLAAVDVVHVQYSQFLWHPTLVAFLQQLPVPIVVTLHDIHSHLYPPGHWLRLLWQENQRQRGLSQGKSLALRSTWRQTQIYRRQRQSLQAVLGIADAVLTCHQQEKVQLAHLQGHGMIQVIPHFVEMRSPLLPTRRAKQQLGLALETSIVTLQGYIYRTKGHKIAVHALSQLPESIHMIFAGGPSRGNEPFVHELQTLAQDLGLTHRLHITGYLSDSDLDLYLAATDLAICPFQALSASGSISTWLAAGKPILASDLPQIQDYNQLVGQKGVTAISTFSPNTPAVLAAAIQTCLASPVPLPDLQQMLKLETIIQQHQDIYGQLL